MNKLYTAFRLCLPYPAEQHHYAEFLTFLFSPFCLFVAGSKPSIVLTEGQSHSTSLSPGLGNVYESAE